MFVFSHTSKLVNDFLEEMKRLLMPRTPSEIELFKQNNRLQYEQKQQQLAATNAILSAASSDQSRPRVSENNTAHTSHTHMIKHAFRNWAIQTEQSIAVRAEATTVGFDIVKA